MKKFTCLFICLIFYCIPGHCQKGFGYGFTLSRGVTYSQMNEAFESYLFKPEFAGTQSIGYLFTYGFNEKISIETGHEVIQRNFRIQPNYFVGEVKANKYNLGIRYKFPLFFQLDMSLNTGYSYYQNPFPSSGEFTLNAEGPYSGLSYYSKARTVYPSRSYGYYTGAGLDYTISPGHTLRFTLVYNFDTAIALKGDIAFMKFYMIEAGTSNFSARGNYADLRIGYIYHFKREKTDQEQQLTYANNTIIAEVTGAGIAWNLMYDRILYRNNKFKISGQIGTSLLPLLSDEAEFLIPLGMNFFSGNKGHLEGGLGVLHTYSSAEIKETILEREGLVSFPYYLLGYRYQIPQGGIFFRAHAIIFHVNSEVKYKPWLGMGAGYSF